MTTLPSESQQVQRLREEQQKAIIETAEKIKTMQKYKDDYIALKDRLKTLPDKVAHDIMVPFGKLAFMPGKLIHTNEILVLLGDNWFAEKSARESCQTVDRRIQVLDQQLEDLGKQRSLLEPRLSFTSELETMAQEKGDLREIKEEYNAEKEKIWRAEHKEKLRAYNKQRREEEKQARLKYEAGGETVKPDQELWDRLEELEELEEKRKEFERFQESETSSGSSGSDSEENNSHCKIRWKDKSSDNVIYFKHTQDYVNQTSTFSEDQHNTATVNSPADIYTHFTDSKEPKSILKHKYNHPQENSTKDTLVKNIQEQTVINAFTGKIQEKDQLNLQSCNNLSKEKLTQVTEQPPKRISKFKADRMSRK